MAKMTDSEMKQIEITLRGKIGSGGGISALLELLTRLNGLLNPAVFEQPVVVDLTDEEKAAKKAEEDAVVEQVRLEAEKLAQDILDKEASDKFAAAAEDSRQRMAAMVTAGEGTEVLPPPVKGGKSVTSPIVDEPHPVLEPTPVVLVDPSTVPVA